MVLLNGEFYQIQGTVGGIEISVYLLLARIIFVSQKRLMNYANKAVIKYYRVFRLFRNLATSDFMFSCVFVSI
jgi:hypothetical protein